MNRRESPAKKRVQNKLGKKVREETSHSNVWSEATRWSFFFISLSLAFNFTMPTMPNLSLSLAPLLISPRVSKHQHDANVNYEQRSRYENVNVKQKPTMYYHVDDGFFDIVWINLIVFIIGHFVYVYSFVVIIQERPYNSIMFSKLPSHSSFP